MQFHNTRLYIYSLFLTCHAQVGSSVDVGLNLGQSGAAGRAHSLSSLIQVTVTEIACTVQQTLLCEHTHTRTWYSSDLRTAMLIIYMVFSSDPLRGTRRHGNVPSFYMDSHPYKNKTTHRAPTNPSIALLQDYQGLCLHTINTDKAELRSSTSLSAGFPFLNCRHLI